MSDYDLFLEGISDNQQEIVECLDGLFLSYPETIRKMRYNIPFYDYKSWVCYLNPKVNDSIELCFILGKLLSNVQGILHARGRKQVSGIVIKDIHNINLDHIAEIFAEAILLNEDLKSNK